MSRALPKQKKKSDSNDGDGIAMRPMTIEASTEARSSTVIFGRICRNICWSPWICAILSFAILALLLILIGSDDKTEKEIPPSKDEDYSPPDGNEATHETPSGSSDISKVRSEKDLLEYYKGKDVLNAFSFGNEKGLKTIAKKMLRKKLAGKPFVFGAVGDGVLVGGLGNCHRDAYTEIVARTVKSAFESNGLQFQSRIITIGSFCGASSKSIASCKNTLLGNDVDLLHYSFPHTYDEAETRFMLGGMTEGSVHIVEPACVGQTESMTKGENSKLLREYLHYGSNILCLEDGLEHVIGEAYSGQSWGLVGDGIHLEARESDSGLIWRNWIPGPLGHQFLADATSMYLFRALRVMNLLSEKDIIIIDSPSVKQVPSCYSAHTPTYGVSDIVVVDAGNWRLLPGPSAVDDDVPAEKRNEIGCVHPDTCGYYEARGANAGGLTFKIPANSVLPNRRVYVCCCCNSELCVSEQFRDFVSFAWEQPVTTVASTDPAVQGSSIAGKECLLLAKNMPFENKLTIKINKPTAEIAVRIARVIAG